MVTHNLSWFTHINRLHSRLTDNWALGSQQDEYNNPHTNSFGDKLWLTRELPFNTIDFGGYYIHSLYNSRNNFYNPANGGDKTLANAGGKIRSGYFQLNSAAVFLQDHIHPIPILDITPGIRFVDYRMNFHSAIQQDFSFAPEALPGTYSVQDKLPSNQQGRTGLEPSLDINLRPLPWLALYGNYAETWKSPQVGGGGGLFQTVPGQDYQLELGQEYQLGFKVHVQHAGLLNKFAAGAAYYHLRYAKQTIPIALANGNEVVASGTSEYKGVNMYLDDNPLYNLHIFANMNVESATYTSYQVNPSGTGPSSSYNGYPVSYVPDTTLNLGAYYQYPLGAVVLQPRVWAQYVGSQHMYNGINAAPDYRSMPAYQTFNLAMKVSFPIRMPYAGTKLADVTLTALNILNRRYNSYQYISGGGYFGTNGAGAPAQYAAGYINAYPGAPFSLYGSLAIHF
jgi:iron complex outermembrane receptor protein